MTLYSNRALTLLLRTQVCKRICYLILAPPYSPIVVSTLCDLAHKDNRTIIATIHQPSSEIFHLFDDLLLLSEGEVMYQGPKSLAVSYFARLGYPCPKNSNPADFIFYRIVNNESENGVAFNAMDMETAEDVTGEIDKDETNAERIERLLKKWQGSDELKQVLHVVDTPIQTGISKDSFKTMSDPWAQVGWEAYRFFFSK
jgi:ABC-type multidrug transport system ATPase subunit